MEPGQHKPQFLCYNGDIVPFGSLIDPLNRSFQYGDGLFESMRSSGAYVPLLSHHLYRLREGMRALGMNELSFPFDEAIQNAISRLLHRNKYLKAARLRLTVFRKAGGFYSPESNDVEFIIIATPLDSRKFVLNERGLILGLFNEIPVVPSPLTRIKATSALRFVYAAQWAKNQKFDDCVLINQQGNMVETTSSNLFILHENTLYTPPITDGCLPGIMRETVINVCRKIGIEVVTNKSLEPAILNEAKEFFLTNAIHGIRWVVAFEDNGYYHRFSQQLVEQLNSYIKLNE